MPSDSLKGSPKRGLHLGALIGISWLVTLIISLRIDLNQLNPLVTAT